MAKYRKKPVVIEAVVAERMRQDEKWGEQNHCPDRWSLILEEEIGEAAKAFLEGNIEQYRKEMIQAAAVCVAAIEASYRSERRKHDGEQ